MRNAIRDLIALSPLVAACGTSDTSAAARWTGTTDTLPSGHVVVRNTADPVWAEGEAWTLAEELRIGALEGDGPEVLGNVNSLAVDAAGRIWVFESQAQELRVFDANGQHVRTIGRRGGGPGEFAQAVRVEPSPDGHMWVMDPQNNRISVFDTAGNYIEAKQAAGGFVIIPWPGRFDDEGRYYAPVPRPGEDRFSIGMVRYDSALVPIDTLALPNDPVERERFELRSGDGFMIAGVPFQGSLTWRLSPQGTIWALVTDEYRLFELTPDGDTLRTVTREYTPLPVTDVDREDAEQQMKWFVDQGGKVDWSKLPATKPAARSFFLDDVGNLWIELVTPSGEENASYDVFDSDGRFLGTIHMPFPLASSPFPIVRDGVLYGLTRDELDVPYVVRARAPALVDDDSRRLHPPVRAGHVRLSPPRSLGHATPVLCAPASALVAPRCREAYLRLCLPYCDPQRITQLNGQSSARRYAPHADPRTVRTRNRISAQLPFRIPGAPRRSVSYLVASYAPIRSQPTPRRPRFRLLLNLEASRAGRTSFECD